MSHRHLARILLGVGIAVTAASPGFAGQPTVVQVEEWNKPDGSQGITVTPSQVPPGKVVFKVHNVSKDETHELLVVKTDTPPEQFQPETANPTKVDESKLGSVKELPHDLKPRQSANLTLSLTPGQYVLMCNQPGHFMAGMHSILTVSR